MTASRRPWTTRELAYMREHYPTKPVAEIAQALSRPVHSVYQQARTWGLSRLNQVGTYTLEDIQRRCLIDDADGDDACWVWQGYVKDGIPYGWHAGRVRSMRQVVMELYRDAPARRGFFLRATCDTPGCLNPLHLHEAHRRVLARENSNAQPALVRSARFRRQAQANGLAKLDMDKAREIRLSSESSDALARRYGVTAKTIRSVRRGDSWVEGLVVMV